MSGRDHFSIAKPDGRDAIQHRLLLRFIEEITKQEPPDLPTEPELLTRLKARFDARSEVRPEYFRASNGYTLALPAENSCGSVSCGRIEPDLGKDRRDHLIRAFYPISTLRRQYQL